MSEIPPGFGDLLEAEEYDYSMKLRRMSRDELGAELMARQDEYRKSPRGCLRLMADALFLCVVREIHERAR